MNLSVEELEAKIKQVEADLGRQDTDKGKEVLASYLDFLKDELKEAKKGLA